MSQSRNLDDFMLKHRQWLALHQGCPPIPPQRIPTKEFPLAVHFASEGNPATLDLTQAKIVLAIQCLGAVSLNPQDHLEALGYITNCFLAGNGCVIYVFEEGFSVLMIIPVGKAS